MAKEQKKTKKKKGWVRFRHRIIRALAYCVLYPYTKIKYHAKAVKFKEKEKRAHLVLFNHQTEVDQFIVGSSFNKTVYFVATEDIFSNGWISRLLEWAIAPIPIKKQATDPRAVMNCIRIRKEGGTIALAPEGNRTFSGKTEYMKSAIVGFVKGLKMPLLLYRIEGGYGVHPRWSNVTRSGKIVGKVHRVVEPEEYLAMSDEELYDLICKELYVNEGQADGEYKHKNLAEYIERAYYVCPDCGLTTYVSQGDTFTCQKCQKMVRYLPTKELKGEGFDFPFRFTTEWYDYQSEFINGLDTLALGDTLLYTDKVAFFEVKLYDKKYSIDDNATVKLYGSGIVVETKEKTYSFPFAEISTASVLGRNKVNLYFEGSVY
ncbi:MAG: 1-acyl-sn-glycerol-3-phosphate acyltransferase, partial [Clostridia bacterium]|nr:1-acyl-sn-glycerol-3-phosphate acyltransferase [Clostridia bacterium]